MHNYRKSPLLSVPLKKQLPTPTRFSFLDIKGDHAAFLTITTAFAEYVVLLSEFLQHPN
jgi:hypothetical protein